MSIDTLNKVNINEAAELLNLAIGDAFEREVIPPNLMLHGTYGVGKSAIVSQAAKKLGIEFGREVELIDIRLGCYEASEVQGIPYNADDYNNVLFNDANGNPVYAKTMKHSTPSWFPTDPTKLYILFLDEFSNAPMDVQHAAYRLLLDRSIQNGTKLPDTVAIVLAGNLPEDKTGVKKMLPAAANRIHTHLIIDSDQIAGEAFTDYAIRHHWHPSLIGFLAWKKQALIDMDPTEMAIARPRTWEAVDGHLKNARMARSPHLQQIAIAGAVGSGMATDFFGYRESEQFLPNFDKVRAGKETYTPPQPAEDQLLYALALALSFEISSDLRKADENGLDSVRKELNNLCALLEHVPKEMKVVFFKSLGSMNKKNGKYFVQHDDRGGLREHLQPVASTISAFNKKVEQAEAA